MFGKHLTALGAASILAVSPLSAQVSDEGQRATFGDRESGQETNSGPRTSIDPYIEVSQIFSQELSPGDDFVTYTQLAAGVDATIAGRRNAGTISLRYERNISYDDDDFGGDTLTGIARGYTTIVPNNLTLEAGALASRTRIDSNGSNIINPISGSDQTAETYSGYVGPNFQARAGDVELTGNYRLGYTRVDSPEFTTNGTDAISVFDESVTHSAQVRAGTRPGEPLPVGVGVGAGYFQEDVNTLDQRVRDAYARADVTLPVTPTLAVVGGVGVEDVEVSSRDALRDAGGVPIVDGSGRLVTDESAPRQIAFEADGLIWDVGVIWRPSRRTQLQATFGRRYDSETYYGSFTWQPSRDTNLGIAVYDGISGLGGRLNNSLASLPVDFDVVRDPISGDVIGCSNSLDGSGCLSGVLGSVRSSVFRGRGVAANFSRRVGRMTGSINAGYDRRKFIGATGTILAAANGVVDESYYVSGSVGGPIGPNSDFGVTTYASWFDSGFVGVGDVSALGTSAAYNHRLTRGLTARAAAALNYLDSDIVAEDLKIVSALVGLRYDF